MSDEDNDRKVVGMTIEADGVSSEMSLHATDDLGQRRVLEAGRVIDEKAGDIFPGMVLGFAIGNLRSRGITADEITDFVRAFYALEPGAPPAGG